MTTTKPYLIRAIWEWCVDQGLTPYIAVAVDDGTHVPREHVRDGQIVLNVGAEATHKLEMGNEEITFQARFNGVPFPIRVPVARVAAIYARENGEGMGFEVDEASSLPQQSAPADRSPGPEDGGGPAGRPRLTRVK